MPEKPIPEQDPITGKSYAIHYVIATIILIATLFWALYDEAWGQRPWKAFQDQWKDRYPAFLDTAKSKSAKIGTSRRERFRNTPLSKQAYEKAVSGLQGRKPTKLARNSMTPARVCSRCKASSPIAVPMSTP